MFDQPWEVHPDVDTPVNDLPSRVAELEEDLAVTEDLYRKTNNKKTKEALNKLRWLLIATQHRINTGEF